MKLGYRFKGFVGSCFDKAFGFIKNMSSSQKLGVKFLWGPIYVSKLVLVPCCFSVHCFHPQCQLQSLKHWSFCHNCSILYYSSHIPSRALINKTNWLLLLLLFQFCVATLQLSIWEISKISAENSTRYSSSIWRCSEDHLHMQDGDRYFDNANPVAFH